MIVVKPDFENIIISSVWMARNLEIHFNTSPNKPSFHIIKPIPVRTRRKPVA